MWTRRLTWPGERDDDWVVLRDGVIVGRVYQVTYYNPMREVWAWFKQTIPGRSGEAKTLEAALEAVRQAVGE